MHYETTLGSHRGYRYKIILAPVQHNFGLSKMFYINNIHMNKVYMHMHPRSRCCCHCIRSWQTWNRSPLRSSNGCEIVVVSSLQLLHDLIWDIPVQFQLQLANYQAQECETIGDVGVDLCAQQKIVHIKSKMCCPVPLLVFNSTSATHGGKKAIWSGTGGFSIVE